MTHYITPTNILLTFVLLILFVTAVIFVYHVYVFVRNKGVPTISTFAKQRELFVEHVHIPDGSTIIDLGCGYGGMLRHICKHYSIAKAVGVDLNGRAIRRGNFAYKHIYTHNVDTIYTLQTADILSTDISDYDYIYVFLLPETLALIQPYIQQHMKPGAQVISNSFHFPQREPTQVICDANAKPQLYIYE